MSPKRFQRFQSVSLQYCRGPKILSPDADWCEYSQNIHCVLNVT